MPLEAIRCLRLLRQYHEDLGLPLSDLATVSGLSDDEDIVLE